MRFRSEHHDAAGREAASLLNNDLGSGTYKIDFNAGKLASGVYFYSLQTNGFVKTMKMALMK